MYHVLVADDEPRHRRGIADMIKMPGKRLSSARLITCSNRWNQKTLQT